MALLAFKDVHKSCPDGARRFPLLAGVCFAVEEGEFVGIRGPRRAGKSALLELAAGLSVAESGSVCVDGVDIGRLGGEQRIAFLHGRVGLASAKQRSHRDARVVDHVAMSLLSDGRVSPRDARVQAREALARVAAHELADLAITRLSDGEAARVELARALVARPALLLIDDLPVLRSPRETDALYELVESLGHAGDLTVVVASETLELTRRAPRMLAIGAGTVRELSELGAVLPFPQRQAGDASG